MFAKRGAEPVGMCVVFKGATDGHLMHGVTGVAKELRGHGIGTILKARLVKNAVAAGFKTIATDNDIRNAPMVAINERLGFEQRPATIHMMWSVDESN